jgi:DNA-binding CsgD family transcriptional regulator
MKSNSIYSSILAHGISSDELNYEDVKFAYKFALKISRISFQHVFLLDYYLQKFNYISSNTLFLCGESVDVVKEQGLDFFFMHLPKDELALCQEIHASAVALFKTLTDEERETFVVSSHFHMVYDTDKILINVKFMPLAFTESGDFVLGLFLVTLSPYKVAGRVEVIYGENTIKIFDVEHHCWKAEDCLKLTQVDKFILHQAARGLSNDDISDKVCKSTSSVKQARQRLLEKMGVDNVQEALILSIYRNLI